jgi:hypothetical protein
MNKEMNHEFPFSRSFFCPHCGTKAQFNLIFPNIAGQNEENRDKQIKKASFEVRTVESHLYKIWRCQVCHRLTFRARRVPKYGQDEIIGQFPSNIRLDTDFGETVSPGILDDFASAIKCFEFNEYRASAALCRRSLQSSLLEQKADPKKKLVDQIDELNSKNPDRFTNDIKDWAHQIRVFGNWGAHPDNDGLKDVDEPTAQEIIDFMKSYFKYVYEMPAKVIKAQATRKPQKILSCLFQDYGLGNIYNLFLYSNMSIYFVAI